MNPEGVHAERRSGPPELNRLVFSRAVILKATSAVNLCSSPIGLHVLSPLKSSDLDSGRKDSAHPLPVQIRVHVPAVHQRSAVSLGPHRRLAWEKLGECLCDVCLRILLNVNSDSVRT